MVADQILVDSRIDLSGSKGTVKYVGEVEGVEGVWLGVDWDEPERGKHNGTHKGIQYFTASHPTSGSFVRPGKVSTGISIVEAIEKRYGSPTDPNSGLDIECMMQVKREIKAKLFEIVGAKKLIQIQSDFNNLRVVFLREIPVNGAGPPLALFRLCPNIQELDLSKTLLSSWESVADITNQLKNLKILNLSENRLKISGTVDSESFSKLQHIVLGKLMYNWFQVLKCGEFLLDIEALQLQFNQIDILEAPSHNIFTRLNFLDLEGNPLKSWDEVNKLGHLPNLEILNVSHCGIEKVSFPSLEMSLGITHIFQKLKNLILTGNKITDWASISEMDKLKSLIELRFRENPVLEKNNSDMNRQIIIARIKNLKVLNGQVIEAEDRKGAEIDYLKQFGREWLALKSDEEKDNFNKIHPNYQRIIDRFGAPEENELKKLPTNLKSQLIQLEIFNEDKSFLKKVPYNMSVQKLSGLVQRLFNTGLTIPQLFCIHAQRTDGIEVPLEDYLKDLNFYSVENGDKISVRW